ncbi:hypothetical protein BH23PAT2_BH23PAT2_01230 [soil metagenome]
MGELAEQIGLPELAQIDQEETANNFMPAVLTGLSDGDMVIMHQHYSDSHNRRLYGEFNFNDGAVARHVLEAALENGRQPSPILHFQDFAADYYDHPENRMSLQSASVVRIYPEAAIVDDNPLMLPHQPQLVIDYGACLTSRSFIEDQMDFIKNGKPPFAFTPITRLPFINKVLMQTYDKLFGPGVTSVAVENRVFIGREDGISSATDEIIESQQAAGDSEEVADIISCTGIQHTNQENLVRGIANAYKILREAGMFIIRAYAKPAVDEIGTDELAEHAFESGFREQARLEYSAVSHNLGALALGQWPTREMKTIVLTK